MSRSSHRTCSMKKAFLKNFAIFKEKNLCWSLFFIKLFQYRCFPVNIAKFFKSNHFEEHLRTAVLIVVLNSNEEQYLLAKLDEIWQDIIVLYLFVSFGIIIFVLYLEAVTRRCSLKRCP